GQARDDRVRRPRGQELPRRDGVAEHGVVGREVEVLAIERDPAPSVLADPLLDLGAAVAVLVTQCEEGAGRVPPVQERDVDVAVRRDGQVACRPDPVGDDEGAEPGRQRQPAVVRVAGRRRGVRGDLGFAAAAGRSRGEEERAEHQESGPGPAVVATSHTVSLGRGWTAWMTGCIIAPAERRSTSASCELGTRPPSAAREKPKLSQQIPLTRFYRTRIWTRPARRRRGRGPLVRGPR